MANSQGLILALDQITLTDITDNYMLDLSQDSYVFTGDSPSGASPSSTGCAITAKVFKGTDELKGYNTTVGGAHNYPELKSITTSYSGNVLSITKTSGSGDWDNSGATPVWKPYEFNIAVATDKTLSTVQNFNIIATIAFDNNIQHDVVVQKTFTATTSKAGAVITSSAYWYGYSNSGTSPSSVPDASSTTDGHWQQNSQWNPIPAGYYAWAKTINTFSDGQTSTSYSVTYIPIDGYTVVLDNESHLFPVGVSASTDIYATAYKGSTLITDYTFGTVTIPLAYQNKMTATLSENDTKLTIAITSDFKSLSIANGELTIPVSVDGKIFNKRFSWGLNKSQYTWIRYCADPTDNNMSNTPGPAYTYIGIAATDSDTCPAKSSFTWTKYLGEDGYTIWTSDGTLRPVPNQSGKYYLAISALVGPEVTPKINELVVWSRLKQYEILEVDTTNGVVMLGNEQDLKGTPTTVYSLVTDYAAITKKTDGTYTPSSLTFHVDSKTGDSAVQTYTNGIYRTYTDETIDDSTTNNGWKALQSSNTYGLGSSAHTPSTSVKIEIAQGTTTNPGTTIDTQTIPIVKDGEDGTDGYTVWKTSAQPDSNHRISFNSLTGPTGVTPKVGELVTYNNRFQYYIQSVDTTNSRVTVDSGIDLKAVNEATITLYKRASSAPNKPYNGESEDITYTFATRSFSLDPDASTISDANKWYKTPPAIVNDQALYSSTISLSTREDTITFASTDWSSPVKVSEDTRSVSISATGNEFISKDGGVTYSPNSIVLTPTFQNTNPSESGNNTCWAYSVDNGVLYTTIDKTVAPWNANYNATTKALTIQKGNVSDSTGFAAFKNKYAIIFRCTSTGGLSDYVTIIKNKDDKAISQYTTQYAQSSSGTTPPSGDPDPWKSSIAAVGTIAPGDYLWTRSRFQYVDTTYSDYTYTASLQGITGIGIKSITPLNYLVGPIIEGYKFGDAFYEDLAHTQLITPTNDYYYYNKTNNDYYKYTNNTYGSAITDEPPAVPPAAPTLPVTPETSVNTGVMDWTTEIPKYVTGGKYYTCQQEEYDTTPATYKWSPVVLNNVVTDAYIEIDRQQGEINMISEQVVNLEQEEDTTAANITIQKEAYIGSLHRFSIAPTEQPSHSPRYQATGGCIAQLYPRTDLFPSESLYPRQIILQINCHDNELWDWNASIEAREDSSNNLYYLTSDLIRKSSQILHPNDNSIEIGHIINYNSSSGYDYWYEVTKISGTTVYVEEYPVYGTKYQYYLDIDTLNWYSDKYRDEFVYEDGECWIIRRTQYINGSLTYLEPEDKVPCRNIITPVNSTIAINGKDVQVRDATIWIPKNKGVTLDLILANDDDRNNRSFYYNIVYLKDNVYTSNFTSSLDLISQINMTPGHIKIKANTIELEGYTTINGGFKIDLEGNMECNDANINGSLVTKDGVLTKLTYFSQNIGWFLPEYVSSKQFDLNIVGFNFDSGGFMSEPTTAYLYFLINLPKNFIIKEATLTAESRPVDWIGYTSATSCIGAPQSMGLYSKDYISGYKATYNSDMESTPDNPINFERITSVSLHNYSKSENEIWTTENFSQWFLDNPKKYYELAYKTSMSPPTVSGSDPTAALGPYSGWMVGQIDLIGYMQTDGWEESE